MWDGVGSSTMVTPESHGLWHVFAAPHVGDVELDLSLDPIVVHDRRSAAKRWDVPDAGWVRPGQTASTATPSANAASTPRSPGSEVNTVPPGSAAATTIASTADPRRALVRRLAARRALARGRDSRTSHVFNKLLVLASRRGSPVRLSTSTSDGTSGGHAPSLRSAVSNAAVSRDRRDRQLTPPESKTTSATSARRRLGTGSVVADPAGDGLCAGHLIPCRLTHLGNQVRDVGIGGRQQILPAYLGAYGLLQELGRREPTGFHLCVEIVGQVHLKARHTPNYTHLIA